MENIKFFLIIGSYTLILNFFLGKFSWLKDKKYSSSHKAFTNQLKTPPFSGGILFIITVLIYFLQNNFELSILFFLVFLIGFLSDTNILKSANLRFILQIFFLIIFISFLDISIKSIRVEFIDNLFQNIFFKIFFSTFCILVLINGTNFIDGLNTLVIGYYFLVLIFINVVLNESLNIFSNDHNFIILFSILFFLFFLNFFELLYLGDNGAYLIALFFGIYLIDIYNNSTLISPYYIVNLLWYPAYENLFSISRKIYLRYSAFKPDNKHLHQLIYSFIKKKIKHNSNFVNTFSGIIINLFNLIIFSIASQNYSNSKFQIILLIISLTIYNSTYLILKRSLAK